jgi:hypothetical protein
VARKRSCGKKQQRAFEDAFSPAAARIGSAPLGVIGAKAALPGATVVVPTFDEAPMRRSALLRTLTLALAFVHTFPARSHLAAFFLAASWTDGWKGFGALGAIALYLLPPATQARGLQFVWRRRASTLRVAGFVLAAAHAFPAVDHLPRFFATASLGDAWRGVGAGTAVAWFLLPLRVQATLLAALVRWARLPSVKPPTRVAPIA